MELITNRIENNKLYICPNGRIDSSNAPLTEEGCLKAIADNSGLEVALDFENLEYISSAGLRIILKLKKDHKELEVVNASSEVYEILEMTGFTEMLKVSKGYRHLSVEGCEVIGKGANGEVYRLDPDTIIKVYLNPDSLGDIQRERELARKAFVLGVPTAIPYDVVKVGNSYGSVFELLNAKPFSKILADNDLPKEEVARMNAELLLKIHGTEVIDGSMPDMKKVAVNWVEFLKDYLPEPEFSKLLKMVNDVPYNEHMMHGDYHVKNVMYQNNEYLLIDMDTLAIGDPVFEFASMFNAYLGYNSEKGNGCEKFLGIKQELCDYMWKQTLKLYFNTEDETKLMDIQNKASLIGYARIMRRYIRRHDINDAETKEVIENYMNLIVDLVHKVDTLDLFK